SVRLAGALAGRRVVVAVDPGVLAVDGVAGVDQDGVSRLQLLLDLVGRDLLDPRLDLVDRLGCHQVVSPSRSSPTPSSASSVPTAISPSTGKSRSVHSFAPPMIEATFLKPCSFRSASAVRAERLPSP